MTNPLVQNQALQQQPLLNSQSTNNMSSQFYNAYHQQHARTNNNNTNGNNKNYNTNSNLKETKNIFNHHSMNNYPDEVKYFIILN
jgi:hypothetical protein